jgi:uncharacterized membrane-anchored protein
MERSSQRSKIWIRINMQDALALLTFDWFLRRAIVGVAVGYFLRVFEHVMWSTKAPPEQNPHGNFGFAMMILPQSLVIGLTLGYVLLAVVAFFFKNATVVEISTYMLTGLMSFLATDLRDLLRRISRI